jgi:hypothetical protein
MTASRNIANTHTPRGRELKAAAVDVEVKRELATQRALDTAKIARLKALRLAREATGDKPPSP